MTPCTASSPRDWRTPLAVLALLAVTVAVFGRVCGHEFTWWDDPMTIHQNPRYNPPTAEGIAETWRVSVDGLYVPITYNYWGALAHVAELPRPTEHGIQLDARVFHAGSLVLHAASVVVVFSLLQLLSRNLPASVGGALVFAVHPVQVEPVAWASGAKDLLCGLLSLCAVYLYVVYATTEGRKRWGYYAGGMVVLVLAMLAKPAAMVVPVLVAAIDLLILRRSWRRVGWSAAGWMVAVVPLALVAWVAQDASRVPPVPVWQRPLIAADAITFYLWKLIWPVGMTPDYGRRPAVVAQMAGGAWLYAVWLIPAGLAVWAWRGRVARPWVLAGAVVFVAGVGPVLGLTPFMFQYMSTVADHYLYLAMLGPALVVTWALVRFPRPAFQGVAAVAIVALAVRANVQIGHWRTDHTLWAHAITVAPNSFIAPTNLACDLGRSGTLLARRAAELREQGEAAGAAALDARRRELFERAVTLLEQAIRIQPEYMPARHNAVVNCLRLGQYERAAGHVEQMIALNQARQASGRGAGDFVTYHDTAGSLWMRLGRYDRAIPHLEKVVAGMPHRAAAARKSLEEARQKVTAQVQLETLGND